MVQQLLKCDAMTMRQSYQAPQSDRQLYILSFHSPLRQIPLSLCFLTLLSFFFFSLLFPGVLSNPFFLLMFGLRR